MGYFRGPLVRGTLSPGRDCLGPATEDELAEEHGAHLPHADGIQGIGENSSGDRTPSVRRGCGREACAQQERKQLLDKVYNGAAGELIAAFLKESHMTQAERDRLRKLLDEMEV